MPNRILSKKTTIGGLEVRYLVAGRGEPLVIVHGGGAGARSWLKTISQLVEQYRIYVPDLPGFGESQSPPENSDMPAYVRFVEDFVDSLGLESFYLMGHSFGSGIAMYFALKSPYRVKKLVLVSSVYLGIAPWIRILSSPVLYRLLAKPARTLIDAMKWVIRYYSPFEFADPLPQAKLDLAKFMSAMKDQVTGLLDNFSRLLMPTLLVCGRWDMIVPVSRAYSVAQLVPNCQLKVFEDGGHDLYSRKSKEFSQLLKEFLK